MLDSTQLTHASRHAPQSGSTALHLAASRGHQGIVATLLPKARESTDDGWMDNVCLVIFLSRGSPCLTLFTWALPSCTLCVLHIALSASHFLLPGTVSQTHLAAGWLEFLACGCKEGPRWRDTRVGHAPQAAEFDVSVGEIADGQGSGETLHVEC